MTGLRATGFLRMSFRILFWKSINSGCSAAISYSTAPRIRRIFLLKHFIHFKLLNYSNFNTIHSLNKNSVNFIKFHNYDIKDNLYFSFSLPLPKVYVNFFFSLFLFLLSCFLEGCQLRTKKVRIVHRNGIQLFIWKKQQKTLSYNVYFLNPWHR